ncbi:MAG: alpha/beta hydrolase [Planctomycetota bacterium]
MIVILYGSLCGLMMGLETWLVFPGAYIDSSGVNDPNRFTPESDWRADVIAFPYAAIDGTEIVGRMTVKPMPSHVVLFLHGNGIRACQMDDWTQRLSGALNATVLTAEYRGFSDDGHTPSEETATQDALSALDALSAATKTPAEQIVIYGRSLGGGVAAGLVRATMDRSAPTQTLVLDRTFNSVLAVGAEQFWFLPVRWLLRNRFDSVPKLVDFAGRVIQIHGPPDRIVPMRFGRALHDSLTTEDKQWIEVPGLRHNDRLPQSTLQQVGRAL